jgi:hypothetical protein
MFLSQRRMHNFLVTRKLRVKFVVKAKHWGPDQVRKLVREFQQQTYGFNRSALNMRP